MVNVFSALHVFGMAGKFAVEIRWLVAWEFTSLSYEAESYV